MKKVFTFAKLSKILPISPDVYTHYDNFELYVPKSAILRAGWTDNDFKVISDIIPEEADIILTTEPLPVDFIHSLKPGTIVIGSLDPYWNPSIVKALAERHITTFALDLMVRSTKAQYMDVMSSQANLAGYRAVIEAAFYIDHSMPLMITTAGTLSAAKVLVVGAGVAGLQAIATAKRLGAKVCALDVRSTAKEQVESLGASFVDFTVEQQTGVYAKEISEEVRNLQQKALSEILPTQDIVITTAQIPGKPAPIILTHELLRLMKHDAIVIDITAKHGGNCEYSNFPDNQVPRILRYENILENIPKTASLLYSKNVLNFIKYMQQFHLESLENADDEIIRSTLLTYKGKVMINLTT